MQIIGLYSWRVCVYKVLGGAQKCEFKHYHTPPHPPKRHKHKWFLSHILGAAEQCWWRTICCPVSKVEKNQLEELAVIWRVVIASVNPCQQSYVILFLQMKSDSDPRRRRGREPCFLCSLPPSPAAPGKGSSTAFVLGIHSPFLPKVNVSESPGPWVK